jgi:hypothetical protein
MALMDSRSSEALARSASVLMPGQTLKSWLVRFGCFCSVLFGWCGDRGRVLRLLGALWYQGLRFLGDLVLA